MRKYEIAVIDFETMNTSTNSPCEVGITLINDLQIVDSYSSYINPKNNTYNSENAKVHKISKETILNARAFDVVYKEMEPYLKESQIIIAHNANFDVSVLKTTMEDYDLRFPNFLYVDSVNIFRLYLHNRSVSISNLCDYYNVSKENLHSAIFDTEKLATLLIKLASENEFPSVLEMLISSGNHYFKFSKTVNAVRSFGKPFSFQKGANTNKIKSVKIINTNNENLSGKNIVFTGLFDSGKEKLQIKARENNANVSRSVSKKTNILVEGEQEERYKDENGLVSNQRKARELIGNGFDINIINEMEFLQLLGEDNHG